MIALNTHARSPRKAMNGRRRIKDVVADPESDLGDETRTPATAWHRRRGAMKGISWAKRVLADASVVAGNSTTD